MANLINQKYLQETLEMLANITGEATSQEEAEKKKTNYYLKIVNEAIFKCFFLDGGYIDTAYNCWNFKNKRELYIYLKGLMAGLKNK